VLGEGAAGAVEHAATGGLHAFRADLRHDSRVANRTSVLQ
jgi:hypothetical protein